MKTRISCVSHKVNYEFVGYRSFKDHSTRVALNKFNS